MSSPKRPHGVHRAQLARRSAARTRTPARRLCLFNTLLGCWNRRHLHAQRVSGAM
ncbi:MAG: hypothetical protein ACLSVD_10930 [Eggerthellaceae bacterium]